MLKRLKNIFKSLGSFLGATIAAWNSDNVTRLSAAIAFYAVFSLSPLFVIIIAIAGIVYGEKAVRGQIVHQIEGFVGFRGAEIIQAMIAGASKHSTGIAATILASLALLYGASGFFIQLKGALNTIWGVQRKPGGNVVVGFLKNRFFSALMVISSGLLLIALIASTSLLWTITTYFRHLLPIPPVFWQVVDFFVSFIILMLIFVLVMKVVPDVKISWKDVGNGAAVTALLFTVGQFLLALYLGRSSFTSSFGIAGSFVIILIWVYYSAQIFLIGAEMTQIYARRYGRRIEPSVNAIRIKKQSPFEQGSEQK